MRTLAAGICLMLLVTCGCGANPDSMMKEQIQLMNEIATAMESNAPQAEIDELQDRNEALTKRFEAIDLSTAEKRKLLTRHQAELTPATARLQKAMMKKMTDSLKEGGFPGFPQGGVPGFGGN